MPDRVVGRERGSFARQSWTNPSVRKLLEATSGPDPVDAITERARRVVLSAIDAGWSGPPFDPLRLADHLGLRVLPSDDVRDARTVPEPGTGSRIEFNPNLSRGRVRYSIAHEIAHTLFPDCSDQIRNRSRHAELSGDEWQLEAMCNIGAAEILMPFGSLPDARKLALTMESMLSLREQFDVSMEALLIRIAHSAEKPIAMFCASRIEHGRFTGRYRVDYSIPSPSWGREPRWRGILPESTALSECTAIGLRSEPRRMSRPSLTL